MSRKRGYNFNVYMDVPELQKTLDQIKAFDGKSRLKIEEAVSTSTKNIAKGARQRVPVRSGKLKKSIRSRFDKRAVTGYVQARQPHAHLVEFGAKGATVEPKSKKALKIPWSGGMGVGGTYFAASAKIPARKERPFMRPAFEDEKPELIKALKEAVKP